MADNFFKIHKGLNVNPVSSDPSSPENGDIWYNTTLTKFRKRQNGVTEDLDTTGTSSSIVNPNLIINGNFDLWQRGLTFASGAIQYTADRWAARRAANEVNCTFTRSATNNPYSMFAYRCLRNSGTTETEEARVMYGMSEANARPLSGETVTLSLYYYIENNYTGSFVQAQIRTSTTANLAPDPFMGGTLLGSTNVTTRNSWQRASLTATIPSGTRYVSIVFASDDFVGTAPSNDAFFITAVKLELGSTATPFTYHGDSKENDENAALAYYYRTPTTFRPKFSGYADITTVAGAGSFYFPTLMFKTPTITLGAAGSWRVYQATGAPIVPSAIATGDVSRWGIATLSATVTGLTQYNTLTLLWSDGLNSAIIANAEL